MENKKFRIALFMLPLLTQGGGAEKYFIELARNFREREIEADVVTMDENFFRKFARVLHIFTRGNFFGKIDLAGRESEEGIEKSLGDARWRKSSYKNLKNTLAEYDLIYSKNEIVDLLPLKIKGYEKLPPAIVGVHTPIVYPETKSFRSKLHNFLYASFLYRWLLKGVRCVHVSNQFTKKIIEEKFGIKSCLIPYPFSARAIENLARNNPSTIDFDRKKVNIIFAGRLGEQKGIDVLLYCIEKISQGNNLREKISLNIFGSGDEKYENEIARLAENFSFVRYFGHVENKFIPHILGQQDLMIAPSKWETLPYSVLEAQAMGVPVVAFNIPGPSDIIEDGITGFLAISREDFFEKMRMVVRDEISFDRGEIIKNIERKFNQEKIISNLINMFQSALRD